MGPKAKPAAKAKPGANGKKARKVNCKPAALPTDAQASRGSRPSRELDKPPVKVVDLSRHMGEELALGYIELALDRVIAHIHEKEMTARTLQFSAGSCRGLMWQLFSMVAPVLTVDAGGQAHETLLEAEPSSAPIDRWAAQRVPVRKAEHLYNSRGFEKDSSWAKVSRSIDMTSASAAFDMSGQQSQSGGRGAGGFDGTGGGSGRGGSGSARPPSLRRASGKESFGGSTREPRLDGQQGRPR